MNSPHKKETGRRTKGECCGDSKCESGLRNNYFRGKRLTADSFRVEQRYQVDRRQLLNRAIHGWGVVYGYGITAVPPDNRDAKYACRLKIGGGLALDKCGRELVELGGSIRIDDELIVLDENLRRVEHPDFSDAGPEACWLLSVHYAEQSAGPVSIKDPCDCEYQEWDHTCETVRYSVRRVDCDDCCDPEDCELDCKCRRCCGESRAVVVRDPRHQQDANYKDPDHRRDPKRPPRGGCKCLCEHLTNLDIGCECVKLTEIEEPCGRVRVDLRNGIPLACVSVVPEDECDRWAFGSRVEDCGPRRLVKRNDLLFDLIRGCDLTRIEDIGWREWHRKGEPVPFDDFRNAFMGGGDVDTGYVTDKFWVKFSRPVRRDTVRRDCFVMTVIVAERDDSWWEALRVPIVRVERADDNLIDRATVVVDAAWLDDTLKGSYSLFQGRVTRVEIEVRGDFIVDCNGQTVDANAYGRSPSPTGNGTPGGTFLSTFLVGAAPSPPRQVADYNEDRIQGVS